MNKLRYIALHCTATPEGRNITADDIKRWHLVDEGWSRVGYHYLIMLDGTIVQLHPHNSDDVIESWEITNGIRGKNTACIHIVYAGGCSKRKAKDAKWYPAKDTRTDAQKESMEALVKQLVAEHNGIKVAGHNQFDNKACPSFDVPTWCNEIGLPKRNIYNPDLIAKKVNDAKEETS